MKKVIIIGSGFSSLSAACYLAQAGLSVQILEKNAQVGGRARRLSNDGFTFDIGPTWYWMPDVFEKFFMARCIDNDVLPVSPRKKGASRVDRNPLLLFF